MTPQIVLREGKFYRVRDHSETCADGDRYLGRDPGVDEVLSNVGASVGRVLDNNIDREFMAVLQPLQIEHVIPAIREALKSEYLL